MAGADVPAWVALAGAGITAAAGLAGAALNGRWTRDAERVRLQQERELHGTPERIKSLEKAIATASRLREEVAGALRSFENANGRRGSLDQGLWRWTPEIQQELKKHEATLKLRFGIGPVAQCWEFLEWSLAEAVYFCESHELPGVITDDVRAGAADRRQETRQALEAFVDVAGAAV